MSKEKLNIIYTAKDIEQYFSGKLSGAQMHEMEKAALDDPFLAEAMEGYEGMKGVDWNSQLVAVRRQVAEAGSVAKVIPMHRSTGKWWKIAAAILLLAGGTVLTFILTKDKPGDKPGEKIAKTFPTSSDPVTIKDNTAIKPEIKTEQPALSPTKEKSTTASGSNTQNELPVKKDNDLVHQGKARLQEPSKNDDLIDSVKNKRSFASTINPPPPLANNNASDKNKDIVKQNIADKELQLNHSFAAQVVAPDNSPLPFSNISIKSENFGTYADVKGNFRLISTDTVLVIEVRSVGYLPRTFSLRSSLAQNKIVLLEDEVAIKDKMVIQNSDLGNTRKSRRARLVMDSVVNAEPADGWENYNTYVANNIDIPEDLLKKGLHGEVGISFDIQADGAITNIRVDKSLGNDYDEAAKRLIEQGPQWKVKKGKKTSAKVKVQF